MKTNVNKVKDPLGEVYALHIRGKLVELRTSDTSIRKKVCKMTFGKKVFKQCVWVGGNHVMFTDLYKVYKYLGVAVGYGMCKVLTPEQSKHALDKVWRKGKL